MGMIINPYLVQPSSAYGTLTTAWIAATGETDTTILGALNTLESDLTTYGLTSKMKALYPFVGGTATKHKYNFMNTSLYQITWYGGVTHNSNGITGNASNAYGDTFLANNLLGQNDNHTSVYVRTTSGGAGDDLASWNGSFGISNYTNLFGGYTGENNGGGFAIFPQVTQGGLYINRRSSASQFVLQRNTDKQTNNANSTTPLSSSFKILRTGDYNGEYSNKNLSLISIGDGLTDTEASNFYTAVQAFQTTLSRNV